LVALIKAVGPATPVVLIKAFGDPRADVFVSRPIRLNTFREAFASVIVESAA